MKLKQDEKFLMVAQNYHRPRCLAGSFTSKMAAARIWNDSWKEDLNLRQKLKDYVTEGLRRKEILNFMLGDYDCHSWSIRTLDKRVQYFNMRYTDADVAVDEVEEAITQEIEGPGRIPGYRAMQEKLRQVYNLRVPRDLVHAVMYNMDPILRDPGAVIRVERKGVMKVFKYGRMSPWVPTLTEPFPQLQTDASSRLGTKNLCIIVPNHRTASPEFFSCVCTRRLSSRHICLVCSPRLCVYILKGNLHFLLP